MCSKVLILTGSPRRGGNTELLCERFAEGARDAGHEVVTLRVPDLDIHYCTGCDGCIKSGKCVYDDDMATVRSEMEAADAILFASPVYFYTISAQMTALIDRTVPFYRDLHGKSVYIITVAADPDENMMEMAVMAFRGLTQYCMEDAVEKGVIRAAGVYAKGDVKETPYMMQAYQLGRSVE